LPMPIPRAVTRFNRIVTNKVTVVFAGRVPPLAIMRHRGRKSGKEYVTPIMAFPIAGGFAIALTYGPDVDWVRNVLAAGHCQIEYRRRWSSLTNPQMRTLTETSSSFPRIVRTILGLIKTKNVLLWKESDLTSSDRLGGRLVDLLLDRRNLVVR
jgi:deazaflavin-dependent oxidoreductase (nitroreductase family)